MLNPQLVTFPGCELIGISSITTLAHERSNDGFIAPTWAKFYAGDVLNKIPNKIDNTIVAVRYDYQFDENQTFRFFLGCRVTSINFIPNGLESLYLPKDDYAIFTCPRGKSPDNVLTTWSEIEKLKSSDTGGNRKYSFDFEVYDIRTMNYRDSTVDIYIAQAPELNS